MPSIWVDSLGPNLQRALDLMEAAVRDCTDELWRATMWEVPDPGPGRQVRGPDGRLVTEPAERHALVQLYSTPWAIAWHALERLDYMLTGGFVPWRIWPGFAERTGLTPPPVRSVWATPYGGLDVTTISEPWSRPDLISYVAYCRQRVVSTLEELTDDRAATPQGQRAEPYAARLIDKLGHVIEHGSQIRQFITTAGATSDTEQS